MSEQWEELTRPTWSAYGREPPGLPANVTPRLASRESMPTISAPGGRAPSRPKAARPPRPPAPPPMKPRWHGSFGGLRRGA